MEELKPIRGECQDITDLPMEDEKEMTYTKLQQAQCMNSKKKSVNRLLSLFVSML